MKTATFNKENCRFIVDKVMYSVFYEIYLFAPYEIICGQSWTPVPIRKL